MKQSLYRLFVFFILIGVYSTLGLTEQSILDYMNSKYGNVVTKNPISLTNPHFCTEHEEK